MPNIIKDAVVGYDFGTVDVQAGMRKTPIGMDFNTSGKKLDIVKRGMEKDYVLERTAGAYAFGGVEGLGYAVFVGNPATRSNAVSSFTDTSVAGGTAGVVSGEDLSYGGRLSYDMGKMLHAEVSYGVSTATGDEMTLNINGTPFTNVDAENYSVYDIGLKSQPMPGLTLKAEYLSGSNVGHAKDWDQTVWYAHGGYEFTPMVEGVVRYYSSTADLDGDDATMSETWIGANFFLNPEKHHEARIQLFYAMPGGDSEDSDYSDMPGGAGDPGNFHRIKGAQYNAEDGEYEGAFWAMFQTSF
jgi:hypothetical protein